MSDSTLLENGLIVTQDPRRRILKSSSVLIKGALIHAIGNSKDIARDHGRADTIVDATGKVIIPGLINCHQHSSQLLMKGLPSDMSYAKWDMKYVFPIFREAINEHFGLAARMAAAEMLLSGTTTVAEMHAIHKDWNTTDHVAQSYEQTGIRSTIAWGIIEQSAPQYAIVDGTQALREFEQFYHKWHGHADNRVHAWLSPLGFGMCTEDTIRKSGELANKLKTGINTHMSGTRNEVEGTEWTTLKRPPEYLRDLGLLGPKTIVGHATHLNHEDIKILKNTQTSACINPGSNAYLSFGIAPAVEMTRQGVNVCLGTDALGSYSQDMFNVMRSAALQQKLRYGYPEAITASQVLDMATINGAKALAIDDMVGSIEPGKKADLIILDLARIFHQPFQHIEPMLVYSVNRSDVESVYVDGQPLVTQHKLLPIDEETLINNTKTKVRELWEKADLI